MENINKKELIIITDNGKYTALGNTEDYKTHHIDCLIEYAFYNTNFKTTESDDSKLFHKIIYYLITIVKNFTITYSIWIQQKNN